MTEKVFFVGEGRAGGRRRRVREAVLRLLLGRRAALGERVGWHEGHRGPRDGLVDGETPCMMDGGGRKRGVPGTCAAPFGTDAQIGPPLPVRSRTCLAWHQTDPSLRGIVVPDRQKRDTRTKKAKQ